MQCPIYLSAPTACYPARPVRCHSSPSILSWHARACCHARDALQASRASNSSTNPKSQALGGLHLGRKQPGWQKRGGEALRRHVCHASPPTELKEPQGQAAETNDATVQPSNASDGRNSWAKLRVERQTHLPATREEAWRALRELVPRDQWPDTAEVFACLELIHRAEAMQDAEDTLEAFRSANSALEALKPAELPSTPTVRSLAGRVTGGNYGYQQEDEAAAQERIKEERRNSHSEASTSNSSSNGDQPANERVLARSKSLLDPQGIPVAASGDDDRPTPGDMGKVSKESSQHAARSNGKQGNVHSQEQRVKEAITVAGEKMQEIVQDGRQGPKAALKDLARQGAEGAEGLAEQAQQRLRERIAQEYGGPLDSPPHRGGGRTLELPLQTETEQNGKMLQTEPSAPADAQAIVLPTSSVDFDDVSRIEYDRRSRSEVEDRNKVDPQAADKAFLTGIIKLLTKAHYVEFTARDIAMSKSLNSDYLAQLYIRADTKKMDKTLVHDSVEGKGLPSEAEALLVFKRGCGQARRFLEILIQSLPLCRYGQARRRGRMLMPKVDFLQLLVVRAVVGRLASVVGSVWRRAGQVATSTRGRQASSTEKDVEEALAPPTPLQKLGKKAQNTIKKLQDAGVISPRLMLAGGGLYMTLNNWGLIPEADVLPLDQFNQTCAPEEPKRLSPVFVERVSIRDALGGTDGLQRGGFKTLLDPVELVEPTFQELLVLYRETQSDPSGGGVSKLKQRVLGPSPDDLTPKFQQRNPIVMRIYRDIPVPSWKVVFPNKLLQFRPLDGLRSDLLSLAGVISLLAQLKFDSVILEVITVASAVAFVGRVTLSYKRLNDRYERMANDMLARTTVAGQEGVIEYLANSSALQHFEQTALAYLLLQKAGRAVSATQLAADTEGLLEDRFGVKIRFRADDALSEMQRLGLASCNDSESWTAQDPKHAAEKLKAHWDGLLSQRVQSRVGI